MININESDSSDKTDPKLLDRRTLLKIAAWSVPSIAAVAAVPAVAAPVVPAAAAAAPSSVAAAAAAAVPAIVPAASGTTYGASVTSLAKVVRGANFAQSNYCWYLPTVTTLKNVSYVIDPMTSTKASIVPAQPVNGSTNPLALMRLGPNNSQSGTQVVIDGLTLTGTVQPKSSANPLKPGHNYHGLSIYYGRRAKILNSTFIAAAWGDANSPPGETFQIMGFHDSDTYIKNVNVDGRTATGARVGGSPMGFNGSKRPVIEDSYLHHSLVSSLTFSTAGGSPSTASATSDPTTRRIRIEHNANTKMENGYRFPGINHEHVLGDIMHFLPKIAIDWTEWTANHMFFGSWLKSARVHIIVNPSEISGGHPNNRGCLTLAIPKKFNGQQNQQWIRDVVVRDPTGRRLWPYVVSKQATKPMPVNRNSNFVVITA